MTALGTIPCIFLPERVGRGDIRVEGPPRTKDGKKSEHSSEGENLRLVCKSESPHPPVTGWSWFKTLTLGIS